MDYDDVLSIATPEGVEMHLTLAGPASRFVSALLDIIIQLAILVAVAIVLGILGSAGLGGGGVAVLIWSLVSFGVVLGYDVFFEVLNAGRTPGKRVNGLRVVRVEGHPVTFLTSVVRNLIRPIDFLPSAYLLGAVTILASSKNQRLGDVVAGTLVVRDRLGGRKRRELDEGRPPLPDSGYRGPGRAEVWDTSGITQEELVAVRQFLARRYEIDPQARTELAVTLAERLRPKVTGVPDETRGEQFLVALAAAKGGRAS